MNLQKNATQEKNEFIKILERKIFFKNDYSGLVWISPIGLQR